MYTSAKVVVNIGSVIKRGRSREESALDACVWNRARQSVEGVSARWTDKIEVVAGCGWGRRARVRPLHALSRAAGMLASQRSQSCNEEGAFFGARALRRPRGKGSGSPPC